MLRQLVVYIIDGTKHGCVFVCSYSPSRDCCGLLRSTWLATLWLKHPPYQLSSAIQIFV
jgi:hypothetical protein